MLFLSKAEVDQLLDVDELIDAVATGFEAVSDGRASAPPRVAAFTPDGLLGAMPGRLDDMLAAKLVSLFAANPARHGIPAHHALIALFDGSNGVPLAVMDGERITAIRTAAASAVAVRTLAREDASVLAVIGTGVQARVHLEAVPRVREFAEIRVAGRDRAAAEALAAGGSGPAHVVAAESVAAAVDGADVVCLCTHAAEPVLPRSAFGPGMHVGSVGASPQGGELDPELVRAADVLAVEARVAFDPFPAGANELAGIDPGDGVELGEILLGRHPGRTSPEQLTVYKSMGHAVEDAAAARLVYQRALSAGHGTQLEL